MITKETIKNADKIKIICELCKKEIDESQIAWQGSFVLCRKCNDYLKKKEE